MDKIGDGGDLEEEKVVVFMAYKNSVRAFQQRLHQAGVGFETVWGEEPDKQARHNSMERFWQDPSCRVLVGTQAIEQSINLQCSRHLVNFDTILNPARMTQLAGRIRRDGSAFKHVYVHNLRCEGTQEVGYKQLLDREQALLDFVWDESSELFEKLSPLALLALIAG
jgi:superfamily II DNA/RNA helicase